MTESVEEFLARGGVIHNIAMGVTSQYEPPREKKDNEARKNAQKQAQKTYHKSGGHHQVRKVKGASGYMNIVERPTCYSFVLKERTVHSINYGDDKEQALIDILKFRDEYRKEIGYPPASY